MRKAIRYKPVLFTMMISVLIIMAAFLTVLIGREIIIVSEDHAADKKIEKLADALLDEYEYRTGYDAAVISLINKRNKCNIVYAEDVGREDTAILKLYINFQQMDIQKPISSLVPELNRLFEMDTERIVAAFCEENHADYERDPISTLSADEFQDIIRELQQETGVAL